MMYTDVHRSRLVHVIQTTFVRIKYWPESVCIGLYSLIQNYTDLHQCVSICAEAFEINSLYIVLYHSTLVFIYVSRYILFSADLYWLMAVYVHRWNGYWSMLVNDEIVNDSYRLSSKKISTSTGYRSDTVTNLPFIITVTSLDFLL